MERSAELILKYLRGKITPAEHGELEEWLSASPVNRQVFSDLNNPDKVSAALKQIDRFKEDEAWTGVSAKIEGEIEILPVHPSARQYWFRVGWAAALLVLMAGSAYWFMNRQAPREVPRTNRTTDVAPGGNKAVLTLADGTIIVLDSAANGLVSEQGDATVIKLKDGQLAYKIKEVEDDHTTILYNTIKTPRGGQYQIILPDGSAVWLNAASSLRFPASFTGESRRVELSGEAYFEVRQNAASPFFVQTDNCEVQVLGTGFNVNAYTNEASVNTTLIEGALRVKTIADGADDGVIVAPGQQIRQTNKVLKLYEQVNVEEVVAWKNGYFSFDKADIKTVMRQLARWYDLEVVYGGPLPTRRFTGGMQRSLPLSAVLDILKNNNVKFETDGRKITLF